MTLLTKQLLTPNLERMTAMYAYADQHRQAFPAARAKTRHVKLGPEGCAGVQPLQSQLTPETLATSISIMSPEMGRGEHLRI